MGPDQGAWASVIRSLATSNAVNTALIASIAGLVFGFLGLSFAPSSAAYAFYFVMIAPMCVLLFQIILFSIVDRDRLQNDRHVEEKMIISHKIGYMKDGKAIEVEKPSSPIIENPIQGDQI